jgi:hypothetical protein
MPKFKLSILEAQDFEKELIKGINERIGNVAFQTRKGGMGLGLDLKFKGLPFLQLELGKINLRFYQNP